MTDEQHVSAPTVRVVLADDQPVVRHGLAAILDGTDGLEVVGTAADGAALLAQVAALAPDVALVDIRMPGMDGLEATARITAEHPGTKVLVLTTYDLDEYVYDALRAGASGFLLKDVQAERLVEAVRHVADGSLLLGPTVSRRLVADFSTRTPPARAQAPWLATLTEREREVFGLVAQGLSNAELAARLWVTEPTVKSHVSEVLRKSGCRDRVQLVIAAYESGVVAAG